MPTVITTGALCRCSFGLSPCSLNVTSQMKILVGGTPVATIMDSTNANITTFGMCSSPANPAVVAAMGVPQPCTPMPMPCWTGGGKTMIDGKPILTMSSTCQCAYAGTITLVQAGQAKLHSE